MRQARQRTRENDPTNLDPTFHAASAELHSERCLHGKDEEAIEQRFHDVVAAVQKLRARGGKIVFVRLLIPAS